MDNLREAVSLFLEDEDLSKYDLDKNPAINLNIKLNSLSYA
jgi:hypothetical protein